MLPANTLRTAATNPDPPMPLKFSGGRRFTPLQRCVGDVDEFESAWGELPLLVKGSDSSAFADILDIADADRILSSAARRPTVRMVANGTPLDPTAYCSTLRLGGRHLDDVVDPLKVAEHFRRGATLVLQSLHRTWPSVADFVTELQREVSHPVQANAYMTPAAAAGLAPHRDAHDVIVLQLHGSKHWQVEHLGDIQLEAGDTMYIPAGTSHSARTTGESSFHLTLGLIRVTYGDVIARVLAEGPAILDAPLPIGYRNDSPHAVEQRLVTALAETRAHLADLDVEGCVRREQQRRRRPAPRGRLASLIAVDGLTVDDSVRWDAPPPLGRVVDAEKPGRWRPLDHVRPDADARVEIDFGGRTITVPAVVLDAIRRLQSGDAVVVDDLPGLDRPSRLILARRLVQEMACVIEPAAGSVTILPIHPPAMEERHVQ